MNVLLPQPVGPDQEGELAPLDRERDAVEPDVAAGVDDRRVAQLDDRRGRRDRPCGAISRGCMVSSIALTSRGF